MKRIAISELEGVALAQAVADTTRVWEIAHEWFPTMTLDPTFIRAEIRNGQCVLVPHNPMRQDPQMFDPTTDWSQCGPLMDKYLFRIDKPVNGDKCWAQTHDLRTIEGGPNRLIAACRAIVASHSPSGYVEVPDELVEVE